VIYRWHPFCINWYCYAAEGDAEYFSLMNHDAGFIDSYISRMGLILIFSV